MGVHKSILAVTLERAGYQRVYHIHVRKTGGTSLNHSFFESCGEGADDVWRRIRGSKGGVTVSNGLTFVNARQNLIEAGDFFYGYSHFPLHTLRLPPATFTVTILRDPCQRVISHYRMILDNARNETSSSSTNDERRWLGESFSDFITNLPIEKLYNQIFMFSPNLRVQEAFDRIMGCSFYFFTDEFDRGIATLSAKTGLRLDLTHKRQSRAEVTISRQEIAMLRERMEPEYDLLNALRLARAGGRTE